MNIATLVLKAAEQHPNKIAIKHDLECITYSDMARHIKVMSRNLINLGIQQGDRIAIFSDKSIAYVVLLISALQIGAIYVPIDILYSFDFVANILKSAEPKILFCTQSYFSEIKKINPFDNMIDMDEMQSIFETDDINFPCTSDYPIACLLYTSGSTGDPKGVCISHDNIINFVTWCIDEFRLKNNDQFSNHAPFTFDLSLFDLFCSLTLGATVHLLSYPFNTLPSKILDYIIQNEISVWYSVPYFLQLMVQCDQFTSNALRTLRLIFYAGESYPTKQLAALKEKLKHTSIYNFYGPTETNVCAYYQIPDTLDTKGISIPIGKETCRNKLYVTHESGKPAKAGEYGELSVRGNTVAIGYWRSEKFNHYYQTGDIVYINPNDELLFVGRKNNAITIGHIKIYPEEIESIINAHPKVKSCVLFSTALFNETPEKIIVVIQPELQYFNAISIEDINTRYCDEIIITEKIIRTRNGKINRDKKTILSYLKNKKETYARN